MPQPDGPAPESGQQVERVSLRLATTSTGFQNLKPFHDGRYRLTFAQCDLSPARHKVRLSALPVIPGIPVGQTVQPDRHQRSHRILHGGFGFRLQLPIVQTGLPSADPKLDLRQQPATLRSGPHAFQKTRAPGTVIVVVVRVHAALVSCSPKDEAAHVLDQRRRTGDCQFDCVVEGGQSINSTGGVLFVNSCSSVRSKDGSCRQSGSHG